MTDDTEEPIIKAAAIRPKFTRAHDNEVEQEPKKRDAKLELKPPSPSPMGDQQDTGRQVSPQLRREERKEELKKAMRMKREFRRVRGQLFER